MFKDRNYFNQTLSTRVQAEEFLVKLYKADDFFHPDDAPSQIITKEGDEYVPLFTLDECLLLNDRMDEVHSLILDPCEFMLIYWGEL
jgi:hypothetical protein|tara:strand:+ start:938 stop:1198 length:261 start_codon:yes stop_codon:yes gene_type:complete